MCGVHYGNAAKQKCGLCKAVRCVLERRYINERT